MLTPTNLCLRSSRMSKRHVMEIFENNSESSNITILLDVDRDSEGEA